MAYIKSNKSLIEGITTSKADKNHTHDEYAKKTDIVDKLNKQQGTENVGKILVVGTDGNLTLTDMPEGGASGDVTGVLDESNNILLTGYLADGTYTLKYENADGTYSEIGTLEVGAMPEPYNGYDVYETFGGVDDESAAALGVRVIHALSLPGREAPLTAARYLRNTIYHMLEGRE